MVKVRAGLSTYIASNVGAKTAYGERYRKGERISAFVGSTSTSWSAGASPERGKIR
jgi:hypothetical protein